MSRRDAVEQRPVIPVHEIALAIALSLLPLFGQLLATIFRQPFNDRYGLSAVIGLSALLAIFAWKVTGGNRRVAAAMTIVFAAWFLIDFGTWFSSLFQTELWDLPAMQFSSIPNDGPIVMSDPLMFIEADYYEPAEIASRLVFLTDPETARRFTGTDMFDRGFYTMKRWFPIRGQIVEYGAFLTANPKFYAYGPFVDPEDWLFRRLIGSGATVKLMGQSIYNATHGDRCMLVEVAHLPRPK